MKKIFLPIFLTIMFIPLTVSAKDYAYANRTRASFEIKSSPSTSSSTIGYLYGGVNFQIEDTATGSGCGTWYKFKFNDGYAWVCGITTSGVHNVEKYRTQTLRTANRNPETDYERQLQQAGFPASYWDKLTQLHKDHPNWNFVANKTGRDFSYSAWAETGAVEDGDIGKSLLYAYGGNTDLISGFLKTDVYNYKTNQFAMQDAGGFYAARQEVVAYYLDPRNFLNENFIFQFEQLSFNATYHTSSVVSRIFGSGYLSRYAANYVAAGKNKTLSPIHMATRSVQEGLNKENYLTTGGTFTYTGNLYPALRGRQFSNCYNFFNIGAYADTAGAAQNGAIYACGGPNGNETSNGRPWNSVDSALNGGAEFLSNDYIGVGQDTLYFEKYNTASYTQRIPYGHQYMTNITAVAYEGSDTYDAYYDAGLIQSAAFTFIIPVYENMPEKTEMPSSLSPNNYLSALKVDNQAISGFDGDRTGDYRVKVASNKTTVSITGSTVVAGAQIVVNDGKAINLVEGDNRIPVKVIAPNKEERVYTVIIEREKEQNEVKDDFDKLVVDASYRHNNSYVGNIHLNDTGNKIKENITKKNQNATVVVKDSAGKIKDMNTALATGDTLTITLNGKTKTYTLYVYGDVNGDGLAKATDYVLIKNSIMSGEQLDMLASMAADVNSDGQVKATDYVLIKNHIMKGTAL